VAKLVLVEDVPADSFGAMRGSVVYGGDVVAPDPEAWERSARGSGSAQGHGRQPGPSFVPLDRQILLGSAQRPGDLHGDPADRMLVATAARAGGPLVTAGQAILGYTERVGGFAVVDARR
jgi:hypothetical protein